MKHRPTLCSAYMTITAFSVPIESFHCLWLVFIRGVLFAFSQSKPYIDARMPCRRVPHCFSFFLSLELHLLHTLHCKWKASASLLLFHVLSLCSLSPRHASKCEHWPPWSSPVCTHAELAARTVPADLSDFLLLLGTICTHAVALCGSGTLTVHRTTSLECSSLLCSLPFLVKCSSCCHYGTMRGSVNMCVYVCVRLNSSVCHSTCSFFMQIRWAYFLFPLLYTAPIHFVCFKLDTASAVFGDGPSACVFLCASPAPTWRVCEERQLCCRSWYGRRVVA